MTEKNVAKSIRSILTSQSFGILATIGDEYPYCSVISFAFTDDLRQIIFVTRSDTTKFNNMRRDPCVSFVVETTRNDADDLSRASVLTAYGCADMVVEKASDLRGLISARHPDLKPFLAEDDTVLMSITIKKYSLVSNFEAITDFIPS